ncbi:hypothetical protein AX774_g1235 [Zancudomyces culisetae]|uniref:Thioesterase domain-containing protein n=1 Tax=Zancudomyces culisetae TaxID=1213189 RepID=A0A1R1PW69_ZANCU|nr:hypothetical protein AX774_g1235 [Zancudomyces culisetae]|eukprot:OMH85211.1 hypothetical protein AX774_g1235 [Zancudomyces culisetae]
MAKRFGISSTFFLLGAGMSYILSQRKLSATRTDSAKFGQELLAEENKNEEPKKTLESMRNEVSNVSIVKELREKSEIWREVLLSHGLDENRVRQSFLHDTFNQPDHLLLPPTMFVKDDKTECIYIFYIGKKLCGHPGITHGGVQAMLYDEAMARPALLNLPRNTGMTAYLNITYKAPALVNQILILKAKLTELNGRKAFVSAQIENAEGLVLSTAESLFISPKNLELVEDNTNRFKEFN